jgi:ELWxxDGT repeat protein
MNGPLSRPLASLCASLVGALLASATLAQPAYMISDLSEAVPYGYNYWWGPFSEPVTVAGKLYFFQDDGIHGRELWRSDGSALGTFLIRDLCPGSCGSRYPFWESMAPLGDRVVFAADDGVHGVELWMTDGTALGTSLVSDLEPGYRSSFIRELLGAGDQAFFVARRDEVHDALWRTDGTANGTYAIAPPGPIESFAPSSIHEGPGFLYLCNASYGGQEGLWRSDGSSLGTLFIAEVGCWQNSIGKRATMLVAPDGVFYFHGQASGPGLSGPELWRSNGTAAGTWRVKDIHPGEGGSWPSGLTWLGAELLFTADDFSGYRLWRSDGTEAGTLPIALADDAEPRTFEGSWTVAGGRYFFVASDPAHGLEPWTYAGGLASRISDLLPGPDSSVVSAFPNGQHPIFQAFGSEAIFAANDGIFGAEIWRTDGSAAGTERVSDIAPGPLGINLPVFWSLHEPALGGRPLISEHQPAIGERLWRLNLSGTEMELVDVLNTSTSAFDTRGTDRLSLFEFNRGRDCFEGVGSHLYFETRRPEGEGIDLLRTEGASKELEPVLLGLPPLDADCTSVGDRLLYLRGFAFPSADSELLSIEEPSGSIEVLLASGAAQRSIPSFLDAGVTRVFGVDAGLFETNGSPSGTSLRASDLGDGGRIALFGSEVVEAGGALLISDPKEPTGARVLLSGGDDLFVETEAAAVGNRLVFAASDLNHGTEIWASDGTPEGTGLVVDGRPGPASVLGWAGPDRYLEIQDRRLVGTESFVVFAGLSDLAGEELWVTDGTALGTGLLRDIYPGAYPSTPRQFTRIGDRIVFSAEDEEHGLEVWVTNGTFGGTVLLKDIAPGTASSIPDDLVVRRGVLYFSAWSPNYGREAWKSDGTPGGTVRITDVAPGPLSSSPQRFARAGDRLYFSATDQIHGYELWAMIDESPFPLFLDGFETGDTVRWSAVEP